MQRLGKIVLNLEMYSRNISFLVLAQVATTSVATRSFFLNLMVESTLTKSPGQKLVSMYEFKYMYIYTGSSMYRYVYYVI